MFTKKIGISVCMIVKNEESVLDLSLDSISGLYDELIILDTGSTDSTLSIAKKYTDKVYQTKWRNDFSWARNEVQKYAEFNYTLSWDADFILKVKNIKSLRKTLLNNLNKFDVLFFMWNAEIVDKIITKKTFRPFVYKSELFVWQYPIHNRLTLKDPKTPIKEKYLPKVEVDHLKDPIIKANRYSQTEKMLANYLKNNPDDLRILIFYQSTFVFQKKYKESLEIFNKIFSHKSFGSLEKDNQSIVWEQYLFTLLILQNFNKLKILIDELILEFNDNRILLFKADLLFLEKKYLLALEIYEQCIKDPIKNSPFIGMVDMERHYIHPKFMKAKILDLLDNTKDALDILNSIVNKTYRSDIKEYYNYIKSKKE